ncbi:MAG: hypothetical protein ACRDDK_09955 [Cetobacterium sp.]
MIFSQKELNILISEGKNLIENLDGFAMIRKRRIIIYNGELGELVWDYALFNEISFVSMNNPKKIKRLFSDFNDSKTEKEFDYFYNQYKIK